MGTKPYYYDRCCWVCDVAFKTTNNRQLTCSRPCGIEYREQQRFHREAVLAWAHSANDCWVWQGNLTDGGYGPHRRYYQYHRGPIPEGLHIDHLCRNRACVNPWHMEAVTKKVNTLRGEGQPARNARKTHCKRGHELTPDNTYDQAGQGWRNCRECRRQYFRDYRKREGAKLAARDRARWPARREAQNAARAERDRNTKAL